MLSKNNNEYDDSEVLRYKKMIYHSEPIDTENVKLLEKVVKAIEVDRKNALIDSNMTRALKANRALDRAKNVLEEAQKVELQQYELHEIEKGKEEVHDLIHKFDRATQKMVKALKQSLLQERERLIEEIHKEIQDTEQIWHSEEHRREYNRPSSSLRAERYNARQLMSVGRDQEAYACMKHAKQMQREEESENAFHMQQDYENVMQLLNSKIQKQIATFDVDAQNQIDELRAQRREQRETLENRLKKYEEQEIDISDLEHCWNKAQTERIAHDVYEKGRKVEVLPKTFRRLEREIAHKPDVLVLHIPEVKDEESRFIKPIYPPTFE